MKPRDARFEEISAVARDFSSIILASQESGTELTDVLDAYTYLRTRLAQAFSSIARAELKDDPNRLVSKAKHNIVQYTRRIFEGRANLEDFSITGYGGVHGFILAYLFDQAGHSVPADHLRVLTGDQVHTERRVRELRELGFFIDAVKVSSRDHYRLRTVEQDLEFAARYQIKKVLKEKPQDFLPHEAIILREWLA